jgi:two-component system, OmpR family, sensor histidine kinase KdpD
VDARSIRRHWFVRIVLPAVAFPGAATLLALLPSGVSTTSAALAYVVAVMVAAAAGGVSAGLLASALSFLGLNFFFTPPEHTLRVDKLEDLVALGVFIAVSGFVATLLSAVLKQRIRAERREQEAKLLHHFGTRLLAGRPVDEVLREFAQSVVRLFDLARCEVRIEAMNSLVVEERANEPGAEGSPIVVPMVARERVIGQISVVRTSSRTPVSEDEEEVLRTFAAQIALAIEGARLAEEARRAQVDAETSNMRAALFSSVTHDVRTPLASITASVDNLMDPEAHLSAEDRVELLKTIRQEADRLNRLVGNLLHLARVRAGGLEPVKRSESVNDVIEGVVARLQPVLEGREVRLMVRDLPEIPFDVDQIDQVITNLLENAIRFSRPGSPITVTTARWRDTVQVRVTDQGVGIPPADRERVFEPFVRGNTAREGGTGLGLSIARALVRAHGGRIWIEGAPGGGTAVTFQLPVGG